MKIFLIFFFLELIIYYTHTRVFMVTKNHINIKKDIETQGNQLIHLILNTLYFYDFYLWIYNIFYLVYY